MSLKVSLDLGFLESEQIMDNRDAVINNNIIFDVVLENKLSLCFHNLQ